MKLFTFISLITISAVTIFNGSNLLTGTTTELFTYTDENKIVNKIDSVPEDNPVSVNCNNWLNMPDKLCGVTVGDLDVTGNQLTVEAMCDATDIYNLSRSLVSKHEDPSDVNYFLCPDLAQITTTDGFYSITSPCSFVSNKTYHVAMVYNGTSLKLYRNGFLMAETPATGNLATNDWPTTIGEYAYSMYYGQAGISNIFKGYINEVRIWNVARTQQQIRDYMNTSLPNPAAQTGLMGYYTFDDLANKQGNTAFNGTLKGTSTINNTNPNCNYVADSCAVPVTSSCNTWLNMPDKLCGVTVGDLDVTGNQLTVEAMCDAKDIYNLSRSLVSKHEDPRDVNYFLCPDLAQITTSDGFYSITSPCSFVSNKTYHVAMVYNGTSLKLYRNGFLMAETPATGNLVTNNWPTTIGEYAYSMYYGQANISNIFKGYINEVRIWNVARTQQEIRDYMNATLPDPTTQPGLMGYYTFDDLANKQGNPVFDGTLRGTSTINSTNPNCNFVADSCAVLSATCGSEWLRIPNSNSYVTCGPIDVTGDKITVEGMFSRDNDLTPEGFSSLNVVSKHYTTTDVNYLLRVDRAEITTTNGYKTTPAICNTQNNKTYHVAMVYDGSMLKFYRNGYLMSQVACSGNMVQNNWLTTIGATAGNPTTNTSLIGYLNEVRIWNVAKTQEEIRANMSGPLPNPTTAPGLLANYVFNDLSNKQGSSFYDATLWGNATISNASPFCELTIDSCNTVLPVSLTSFSAKAVDNRNIVVNWHTEEEIGIASYIVERATSANGPFITIGTVNAKNSSTGTDYSFTDNTARPNITYFYRLRIVENTETKKYSAIRSAVINVKGLFVNIYPNPATDVLTVQVGNASEVVAINLYNNLGQLLVQKNGASINNSFTTINISSLPKGSYWVQIINGKEKVVKKIEKL